MNPFEEKICRLISANKVISQWQMRREEITSDQLYLIRQETESRRKVLRMQYVLTLIVNNPSGDGEVSFSFVPDDAAFETKMQTAIAAAQMIHNPRFELPAPPQMYPHSLLLDKAALANPDETLNELRERIVSSVQSCPGTRLASAEIYLDRHRVMLKNSKDLMTESESSAIHVDFVLLSGDGLNETDTLCFYKRRLQKDLEIEKQVKKFTSFALDGLNATLPESGTHDVIFGEEALDSLFDYFVYQCGAEANYSKKASVKPGQSILKPESKITGEKLSLYADSTIDGAMSSFPFDSYGFPNGKFHLIEDHRYHFLWGSCKYAQLLGIPPTGEVGNICVVPGTKDLKEIVSASGRPVYHLLRFSTFLPNRVTGDFSGEIRTGYRIDPDGTSHPIRGGAVSGNVKEAFQEAFFSKETLQREGYFGPAAIRLNRLKIGGRES